MPGSPRMLADYEEITSYLLDHELISVERIVASDLAILDLSRRHSNFKIVSESGPCYFLKQDVALPMTDGRATARSASERELATVSHEAEVYRVLEHSHRAEGLRRYLPRCHGFDPAERLLILEAIGESQSLAEYHYRLRRFPRSVASDLGKALAAVHTAFAAGTEDSGRLRRLPATLPWAFALPRPTYRLYLESSSANRELLKIAQGGGTLETLFDELARQWKTDTLIHGDLKWTNCLLVRGPASRRGSRIRLVDWELACRGDACWDLGSLLSEYLNIWLSSVPISGDEPPDRFLDAARFPLERMQPSVRALWGAYVRHAALAPREADGRLMRAVKCSAVRLAQTVFEQLQDQSSVTNGAICRLQLCQNILIRPAEAAVQLFGLPLPQTPPND